MMKPIQQGVPSQEPKVTPVLSKQAEEDGTRTPEPRPKSSQQFHFSKVVSPIRRKLAITMPDAKIFETMKALDGFPECVSAMAALNTLLSNLYYTVCERNEPTAHVSLLATVLQENAQKKPIKAGFGFHHEKAANTYNSVCKVKTEIEKLIGHKKLPLSIDEKLRQLVDYLVAQQRSYILALQNIPKELALSRSAVARVLNPSLSGTGELTDKQIKQALKDLPQITLTPAQQTLANAWHAEAEVERTTPTRRTKRTAEIKDEMEVYDQQIRKKCKRIDESRKKEAKTKFGNGLAARSPLAEHNVGFFSPPLLPSPQALPSERKVGRVVVSLRK